MKEKKKKKKETEKDVRGRIFKELNTEEDEEKIVERS